MWNPIQARVWRRPGRTPPPTSPLVPAGELPLRAELFSLEQLARHARALAARHEPVSSRGSDTLLARLDRNEAILREYNRATHAADRTRRITHAAEWLVDNFYLIEEQIQMARRHLPRGYSRELPPSPPGWISRTSPGV